ncbi:MAG TPA: DMT family transporter [Roseiarcus sp.]|nr:DMT family transporter [Roseiarcus sp.]
MAERRQRTIAILMMCATMVCFAGHDTSAKWLALSLPTVEIVWARYVAAAIFGLIVAGPLRRPTLLMPRRPVMQALRSLMLLGSTMGNFLALRHLQLAETATISFLQPLLVALAAGPLLGEWVGPARLAAIGFGLVGIFVATAPGTNAFQPVTLLAIGGVLCNTVYALLTRVLAAHDAAETTLFWTPLAGVVLLTPVLPFVWVLPPTLFILGIVLLMAVFATAGHGLLILAHRHAPAPILAPFAYTQLLWMIGSGLMVFGDRPPASTLIGAAIIVGCGLFLFSRERGGKTIAEGAVEAR